MALSKIGSSLLDLTTDLVLTGTTPSITIGDAGAEDSKLVFDGNAQDFYIALDDSADDLLIGKGSTVGTTPAIAITEDLLVTVHGGLTMAGTTPTLTIGDAGAEDTKIVFDGNAQDFYIGLDDSADDLLIGLGSAVGTTPAISIDENLKVTLAGDLVVSGDDITMATNTSGAALIADGTNFNPVVISGDAAIATNGALTIEDNAVTLAKMAGLARGKLIVGDASGNPSALAVGSNTQVLTSDGTDVAFAAAAGGGIVVQRVFVEDATLATSTTVWGWDNTIPQNSEGVEVMTLAITPTNSNNKLHIESRVFLANNTAGEQQAICLFQDSTANALSSSLHVTSNVGDRQEAVLILSHYMTAGTTSSTTFKIRAGNGTRTHNHTGGTFTYNGAAGANTYQLGGTLKSQITITEYEV